MRLSGTSATNWLNNIKQYGRQFNDILTLYGASNTMYIPNVAIGTFSQSDINRIEYSVDTNLFKTEMGKLVIDVNKSSALYNYLVENNYIKYEIKIVGNNDYVNYGFFLITKVEEQKDKKSVLVTCYDELVKTMTDYKGFYNTTSDTTFVNEKNYYLYDLNDEKYTRYKGTRTGNPSSLGLYESAFPMTIDDFISKIANKFNFSFTRVFLPSLYNIVTSEHYVDVDGNSLGYTIRDVLDQLAEAIGCRIKFSVGGNNIKTIQLKGVTYNTGRTINEEYFSDKNVTIGKKVGPYNVVVLSRANESDNIHYPATLPQNPYEFKISNNLILEQDNREDYIEEIYNQVNGLEFYENDFSTTGICIFEAGDKYTANIDNTNYTCLMLHDQMIRTTGLKEKTQTTEPKFSVTDYKYSSSTDKAEISSRNAMVLVDKANASIEQIVSAVGENGEVTSASIVQSINDSGSQIKLNADKIYINGVTFDNDQNMTITEGTINIEQSAGDNSIYTYADDSMTNTRTETGLYPAGVSSDIRDLSNNNMDIWANYYCIEARLYDNGYQAMLTATDLTFSDSNNNTKFYVNGTTGETIVGSIRTKNMFDKNTFVQGDITNGFPAIRISSRQNLWLNAGTYTFSTNQSSTYQYVVTIQNVGVPPLSSQPTWVYDSGWQSSSSKTFTISTGGYVCIYIRNANNTNINISEIQNFNYQLEKGSTATTYTPYQELNGTSSGSNSNGMFLKFSDGTLIQWNSMQVTDQAINSAYGSLYQGTRIITFPIPFKDENYSAQCSQFLWGTGASWGAVVTKNSSSTMTIRGFDAYSRATGTKCNISWFAIGRWK